MRLFVLRHLLSNSGLSFIFMTTSILSADPSSQKQTILRAVELLERGEVIALPTETVYGLGADAFNEQAIAKVFEVKERPSFDPLIVHVESYEALDEVAIVASELREVIDKLIAAFWPGPLTLVLPKKPCIGDLVSSGLPTVAVRMSAHPVMKAIIRGLGKPIAAPSANRFGRISPTSAQAVKKELDARIPAIIDGGACKEGLESTIILPKKHEGKILIEILRPGPITREMLRNFGKVVMPRRGEETSMVQVPGHLASHYAPATPLVLCEDIDNFSFEANKAYGLLSFDGQKTWQKAHSWKAIETLSPGKGKLPEAAVRLFHCLRQLDEKGLDRIIAQSIPSRGLGVAIMDRLSRASQRG